MTVAGYSNGRPAARLVLMLGLLLAGAIALAAWGAPGASAQPAEEEYKLQIPDARGGGGSPSPGEARALLGGGGGSSPSGGTSGSTFGYTGGGSPSSGTSSYGGGETGADSATSSGADEALLAKARRGVGDPGLLSAATSAAGKAPLALAIIAALLLITVAGVLAARRRRHANLGDPS